MTSLDGKYFAPHTQWYSLQLGEQGYVIEGTENAQIPLSATAVDAQNQQHLWCFVGNNTDGYRIYNKAAGAGKVLAAPSVVTGNGGESFAVLKDAKQLDGYTDLWILSTSNDLTGKRAFYLNVRTTTVGSSTTAMINLLSGRMVQTTVARLW